MNTYLYLLETNTFWCDSSCSDNLCAGILQARASFSAGILALLAGFLAYQSVIRSTKNAEKQYVQRKFAYKHTLIEILKLIGNNLENNLRIAENIYSQHGAHARFPNLDTIEVSGMLARSDWENHAMFSSKCIEELYSFIYTLVTYNSFTKFYAKKYFGQDISEYNNTSVIQEFRNQSKSLEAKIEKLKNVLLQEKK